MKTLERSPLTAAARRRAPLTAAERTAKILRDNRAHPFCPAIPKPSSTKTTRATGLMGSV